MLAIDIDSKKLRRSRRRPITPAPEELILPEPVVVPDIPLIPSVIKNVLMVEVENVTHDPYKTTEEIKVCLMCGVGYNVRIINETSQLVGRHRFYFV